MIKAIKHMFFIVFLLLGTYEVKANVFASAIEIDYSGSFPATISYSLNQEATSVSITIKDYPASTVVKTITGGTSLGFNDVTWDGSLDAGGTATSGTYTIHINASDNTGTSEFEMISYETNPDSWYWSGSGVAAIKRQASPYFGMTYISERTGKMGHDNGSKPRGIYLHDSHGRYYGQSQVSAYASGNSVIDWDALAGYEGAPWGVTVGPDDRVYACVLSSNGLDAGVTDGGVAIGDALFSTSSVETILPFTGDAVSDMLVVGLGADRVLYTVEQTSERTGSDNDAADDGDGFDAAHIVKYALGESTGQYTGTAVEVIPTSTLSHPFRIEIDSEGFLYVVQQAYSDLAVANNIYGLSKWDISGTSPTEVWHIGLNDAPDHGDSTANADNARATNFNGLALDEANGRVWITRKNNSSTFNILAYDISTGAYQTGFGDGGWSIRDVNVDAAGNILIISSSYEKFRIFSPAGSNSFNTGSPWAIDAGVGVIAVPDDVLVIVNPNNLPAQYSLVQNYPNPFNPVTSIEFTISQNEFVTLNIYDVTGRNVSTVVNNRLNAGNYKMSFDAGSLTSGIYFYELRAGSFISTKKMMLLK
jgi:flagellar hook assembly protein FlgD